MTSLRQLRLTRLSALCLAAPCFLAPATASPQAPVDTIVPVLISAGARPADIRRAEGLEQQAEREARLTRQWRHAATLRSRAARLRGLTAEAITSYQRAAWLFSASGDHGAGRRALEQAAQVALERGDAARAVAVLVDATVMAAADGDPRQTNRLLARTRSLLESAAMPEEVRAALRLRFDHTSRLAAR